MINCLTLHQINKLFLYLEKRMLQTFLFSKNINLRMLPAFAGFLFAAKLNKFFFPTKKYFASHILPKSLIINYLVFHCFTSIYIDVKKKSH
jgi:hypothetical protein